MDYIAPFLLGIAILLVFLVRNQRQLQEKRQKIVVKEHRMFSFLHGLGEALQTSRTREELHQFILKGAMEVVEGAQGALYLLDMKQVRLVPKAMSRQCPPLLPQLLPNYDPTDPARLRSDLLLETVSTDDADSILVGCLSKRESLHVEDLSNHPAFGDASPSDRKKICCDAMLAPMYFGESDLGVMVVLRENGAASFDSNDFAVFGLLADQCSLALGTDQLSRQSIAQQRLEEEILNARDVQRILLPDKAPPPWVPLPQPAVRPCRPWPQTQNLQTPAAQLGSCVSARPEDDTLLAKAGCPAPTHTHGADWASQRCFWTWIRTDQHRA